MWTVLLLLCSWAYFSPLTTWKKDVVCQEGLAPQFQNHPPITKISPSLKICHLFTLPIVCIGVSFPQKLYLLFFAKLPLKYTNCPIPSPLKAIPPYIIGRKGVSIPPFQDHPPSPITKISPSLNVHNPCTLPIVCIGVWTPLKDTVHSFRQYPPLPPTPKVIYWFNFNPTKTVFFLNSIPSFKSN